MVKVLLVDFGEFDKKNQLLLIMGQSYNNSNLLINNNSLSLPFFFPRKSFVIINLFPHYFLSDQLQICYEWIHEFGG